MAREPDEVIRTYEKPLPVKLTQDELREAGLKLANLKQKAELHAAEAAETRAELTEKKTKLDEQMSKLAEVIRNGEETRRVKVEVRQGKRQGWVEEFRTDTNEGIESRAIRAEEAQRPLITQPDAVIVPPASKAEAGAA